MSGAAKRGEAQPARIGTYPIIRKIGEGGFGEVFLAKQPSLDGREVCIKRAHPSRAGDQRLAAMLHEEARLVSQLSHEHIVSFIEAGLDDGVPFIVTEHVSGTDLARLLRTMPGSRLDAELVAHAVVGVARALAHAHDAAVIHRDVKPANVLVSSGGDVKLTDFGIAKIQQAGRYMTTTTHAAVGSEPYMAPELLAYSPEGARIDHRVDLWALGVMAWECLCGFRPFEDDALGARTDLSANQRARVNALCDPPRRRSIHNVAPAAPLALREVIEGLLQPVGARIATADEVVRRLVEAGLGLPTHRAQWVALLVQDTAGEPATMASGVRPAQEVPMSDAAMPEPDTDPAPRLEARPGTLLGPWRIVRELGKGGMGATYVVQHEEVDKRACLKLIRPEHAADPAYREQFLREAKAAAATSHPNVVSLFDFARPDGRDLWALFELVDGAPLSTVLARSPHHCLPAELVAVVALDMAQGLDHLHTPNRRRREVIVHRDVSPQNVVVSFDGHAQLIDLGIAKVLSGPDTQTDVKGKVRYMAPEVLNQGAIGPPADQWAFGVVLYLLLSGRPPYAVAYDGRPPPPLASPLGPLDPRWAAIVSRLMDPGPARRYPSLAPLVDELTPLATSAARRALGALVWKSAPAKSALGADINELREKALAEVERRRELERMAPATPKPAAAEPVAQEPPEPPPGGAPGDLAPGTVLAERYRIVSKLGAGGMGAVYEGQHIAIKRRVAIKIVHAHIAHQPEMVGRFQREAEAATLIGHPNVVEVTDFGKLADGRPFMVLEFLRGRDWDKDIETEGPQPLGKVAHIAVQVCRGLAAAHAHGIVHRDLKPENVFLLEREGDPCFAKIVDFGISKVRGAPGEGGLKLTQTGMALGTPYYMSPEQCRGADDVDHRADIYAFGVMLFRALTGTHPFDAKSYPDLMLRIITAEVPPVARFRPDLPPELCALVERMLAKHPDHRPQSCAEIEQVLRPYVGDPRLPALATAGASTSARPSDRTLPLSPSEPGLPPSVVAAAEPRSSRRLLLVALAMCGLLLAGLTTFAIAMFLPGGDGAERVAPTATTTPPEPPTAPPEPPTAPPTPTVSPSAPTEAPTTVQAATSTETPTTPAPGAPALPPPVDAPATAATPEPSVRESARVTRERSRQVTAPRRPAPQARPLAPASQPGSTSPGRTREGRFSERGSF